MSEGRRSLDDVADEYAARLRASLNDTDTQPEPKLQEFLQQVDDVDRGEAFAYLLEVDRDVHVEVRRGGSSGSGRPRLSEYWDRLPRDLFHEHFATICDRLGLKLPHPGETLGKHRLDEVAGVGGMGVVYRSHDEKLGKDWAIKVILADDDGAPGTAAAQLERRLARFRNEAKLTARLNSEFHGKFLTITELEEANGFHFYTMDFIEGRRSLESEVLGNDGPLESLKAARYLWECADSMKSAHQLKIIHRDLKAANVLLTGDDHARITDFGLAKMVGGADGPAALPVEAAGKTGVAGTLACMAPEQARGEADYRSDVYGLGAIGYFMLTGRQPFHADSERELLELVTGEQPPTPVREVNKSADGKLAQVVMKCLEKDPSRRYQSAQEVEIALANYIGEQEDRAKEKKRKRLPVAAAVGLPLVAVLTALAIYLFYFNEKAPPPTVLSDIVAYQHKCEPEPWLALPVHDIDDVPDPDYSGFEVRVDSRFWDLSRWHRSASAEKDPELSFMTRIMEVKRRPGQASNATLPFHFRTSGRSVNPKCSRVIDSIGRVFTEPAFQRVERGQKKKPQPDNSRLMMAYQLLVDLSQFPEDELLKVVVHAIYVNSFQGKDKEFALARIDAPAEVAQLGLLFPPSKTFGDFELFEYPIGQYEQKKNVRKLGLPRPDPDRGMFGWTIRQSKGMHGYEFEWEWKDR
jgi:serine/threonine protein kinase